MIGILNVLLFIVYGLVFPLIIGLLWTKGIKRYKYSMAMAVVIGLVTMLAVFEILAVPLILQKQSFHLLVIVWKISVWCLFLVSLLINIKRFKGFVQLYIRKTKTLDRTQIFIWLTTLFLIAFQIYMPVGHMRVDTDDARFVAEAMEAYELDTMLQYHPITGEFLGEPIGEMKQDAASPFPIFMALVGILLHLPPTVSTHIFFPILFIITAYLVYYLIGDYFTHENGKYTGLFLFFIALLHCFAYESIYAAGYTLLAVIWQGRSVLAMVIMPYLWLILMQFMDGGEEQSSYYFLLLVVVIGGYLTSSMAMELFPIMIGTYAVIIGVKRQSFIYTILLLFLLFPCVIGYCIYR